MYDNQNNTLPVDPMNAQWPQHNLTMPCPILFAAPSHLPEMGQLMPLVALYVIKELQENAGKNPLRMFLFNLATRDRYNNATMAQIVTTVTELAATSLYGGNNVNAEAIIADAASRVVALWSVFNLQQFPGLVPYLQSTNITQQDIANSFTQLQQLQTAINNFTSALQQRVGQRVNGGFQQPQQQFNQQPRASFNMNGASTSALSSNSSMMSASNNNGIGGNMAKYSGTVVAPVIAAPQSMPAFGNLIAPIVNTSAPASAAPVVAQSVPVTDGVVWVRSTEFPYYPAVNGTKHQVTLKLENGVVKPIITAKERLPMDYSTHCLGKGFGDAIPGVYLPTTPSKANEKIDGAVTEINVACELVKSENEDFSKYTKIVNDKKTHDASLEALWLVNALGYHDGVLKNQFPNTSLFRTYGTVMSPLFSVTDHDIVFVKSLGSNETYGDLQDAMASAKGKVSLQVWLAVNKRLTNHINSVLRNVIGIDTTITSFQEDYTELLEHLTDEFGREVVGQLLRLQQRNISLMFQDGADSLMVDIITVNADSEEEEIIVPKHTYLSHTYSLTYLNHYAADLELDMLNTVACQLTPDLTPELYSLAVSLFDDNLSLNALVETHLIKTKEGFVLEINKGCFNEHFYTASHCVF